MKGCFFFGVEEAKVVHLMGEVVVVVVWGSGCAGKRRVVVVGGCGGP